MNKDIILVSDDNNYVTLFWEENKLCKYIVMGLNDCFVYEKIIELHLNKAKFNKKIFKEYLSIKICYVADGDLNNNIVLGCSKDFSLEDANSSYDKIEIIALKSYSGFTLSFRSKELYDKYYLYEKVNDRFSFIMESEDFQVCLNNFKDDGIYYVEGYKKDGNDYVLKGKSGYVNCKIQKLIKNKDILSIVVPIYNSEKFLSRCIDSILLSTFNDYEIILVDDGSTDKSPEIIDWYGKEYSEFIRVKHQKNEGVNFSRNCGIDLALGSYINFTDSDDIIHPYMFENLISFAVEKNLDVVIGKVVIREKPYDYQYCLDVKCDDNIIYDYDKMFHEKVNYSSDNIFFVAVWNKVMKTSIVKEHLFPQESYYEDIAFTRMIYSYIDRFGFSPFAYYVWDKRIRNTVGTLSTNYNSNNLSDLELNKKYANALFYCVEKGNSIRKDYLIYDYIKEVYGYLSSIDFVYKSSPYRDCYTDKIIKINENYDVLKNKYVIDDEKICDFVKDVLNIKKEL